MTHRHTSLHEVEIEWLYDYEPADPATGSDPAVSNVRAHVLSRGGLKLMAVPNWWAEANADIPSLIIAAQEASDDRRADYAAE
jgi:hypothetical protein